MIRIGQPPIELVDEAEVADQVPEIADLPLVEMGEVDAGAEDAPAGILGMRDRRAAQHAHLGLRVEQRDIDRLLHALERRLVLGVEEARVVHRQHRCLAVTLEAGAAKIQFAGSFVLRQARARTRMRKKHRVAEMRTRRRVAEDLGEKLALRLLQPLLVALREPRFALELLFRGEDAWKQLRRATAQFVHPYEAAAPCGELVVDGERVHSRTALWRRSGRLRRETRSLTHFTERLARSQTIGSGSWR